MADGRNPFTGYHTKKWLAANTPRTLEGIGISEIRVRHHTDIQGLAGIKKTGQINISRGKPYGVDVEVALFKNPSEVNLGQKGKGAYIEFSHPEHNIITPPGYLGGNGNAGRIPTNTPINIRNSNPTFKYWQWWKIW